MLVWMFVGMVVMAIPYHCFNFIKDGKMKTSDDFRDFVIAPFDPVVDILSKMESIGDDR